MRITRKQIREIIKETIEELDEIDCWDGYAPGAQGGPKTKKGTGKNKGKRVNNCEKIKEAIDVMNSDTGQVLVFDDQAVDDVGIRSDAPEAAAMNMMKRLGLLDDAKFETGAFPEFGDTPTYSLPNDKWEMMEDELYGKRAARKSKADKERLDIDNLMARVQDWAMLAGRDYMADNKEFGGSLADVAYDMAQAAETEFAADEWNELLYHFDFNEDNLRMYIAEVIATQGG